MYESVLKPNQQFQPIILNSYLAKRNIGSEFPRIADSGQLLLSLAQLSPSLFFFLFEHPSMRKGRNREKMTKKEEGKF